VKNEDERTARVMTDIANSAMPGIVMKFDVPSRNTNRKMPILDMEVWIEEEDGNIMFQHYQKQSVQFFKPMTDYETMCGFY
jgi:hypothetical protein